MGCGKSVYAKYKHMIHRVADKLRIRRRFPLVAQLMAEFLGTMTLIFYAFGANCQRNLDDGIFNHQFLCNSLASGAGVSIGFMIAGKASPAIMNPAFTFSNAMTSRLPLGQIPIYLVVQVFGAFMGALSVLGVYVTKIHAFADTYDGGLLLANTTGTIFITLSTEAVWQAVVDQIITTGFLTIAVYAIVDGNNLGIPPGTFGLFIGLTVYMVVGTFAANASAALNPARDLGPRIMISIFGKHHPVFRNL